MKKMTGTAIALWMGMAATTAQAAKAPPCLTQDEAKAMFTAILPDMLEGIGKSCSAALPENATLRGGLPVLVAAYRTPAEAAWPDAMKVFGKMSGVEMKDIDPKLIRPMMGPVLAASISEDIKPADCPTIDRALYLLAPLPPTNVSELIVLLAQAGMKGEKSAPFSICKAEPIGVPATIAPHQ